MTNRRKMRKSFQGLSLGFGAIVCALACGADDRQAGSAPHARGGNVVLDPASLDPPRLDPPRLDPPRLDPPRHVANALPAGEQLSPACDDSPLAKACGDPADKTRAARTRTA